MAFKLQELILESFGERNAERVSILNDAQPFITNVEETHSGSQSLHIAKHIFIEYMSDADEGKDQALLEDTFKASGA